MITEELLSVLKGMYEDTRERPSNAFRFAVLAEMGRVLAYYGDDTPPQELIPLYIAIAGGYKSLGQHLFAAECYELALDSALNCVEYMMRGKEEADGFTAWCAELLLIYRRMGRGDNADRVLSAVKTAFPALLEAIERRAYRRHSLKTDPIEYTEEYMAILPELEAKIEAELAGVKHRMGFCHMYWHVKAEILERDYGIIWKSPAIMNPRVRFD